MMIMTMTNPHIYPHLFIHLFIYWFIYLFRYVIRCGVFSGNTCKNHGPWHSPVNFLPWFSQFPHASTLSESSRAKTPEVREPDDFGAPGIRCQKHCLKKSGPRSVLRSGWDQGGLGWIRALERKIQRKSVNGNHPLTGRGGYFLMYFHNFDIFRARNRENMHISWPGYLRLAVKADGISLKTLHLAWKTWFLRYVYLHPSPGRWKTHYPTAHWRTGDSPEKPCSCAKTQT